ncbi:hypothetical protein ACFL47_11305 [Candidatus Latescibacterota bacterium]
MSMKKEEIQGIKDVMNGFNVDMLQRISDNRETNEGAGVFEDVDVEHCIERIQDNLNTVKKLNESMDNMSEEDWEQHLAAIEELKIESFRHLADIANYSMMIRHEMMITG